MENVDNLIKAMGIDKELLLKFFVMFSRFEYALKMCGFVNNKEENGVPAQVDWDKFAMSIKDAEPAERLKKYLSDLLKYAPKKQIMENGSIRWKVRADQGTDMQKSVRVITTVRNNLFHGGKYPIPNGPVDEPARNRQLIEASLKVLECYLLLGENKRIREIFFTVKL